MVFGSAASYDESRVRSLIHLLKYENEKPAGESLLLILLKYSFPILEIWDRYIVVPIPPQPSRMKKRFFDHTLFLAREFSRKTGLHAQPGVLKKKSGIKPQTECATAKERRENIKGSFYVASPEKIRGENILLIDDVCTTGATLKEASRVLKKSGANKISALVVAKT